jgi:hypothetical protein
MIQGELTEHFHEKLATALNFIDKLIGDYLDNLGSKG